MDGETARLYERYLSFQAELRGDLARLKGPGFIEESGLECVRRLEFDEFVALWTRICQNKEMKQRWLRRLNFGYARDKELLMIEVREVLGRRQHPGKGEGPSGRRVAAA